MRQVKLFKGLEMELSMLEAEVNQWIEASGVRVARITGNIAPQTISNDGKSRFDASDVLIIVEYETNT